MCSWQPYSELDLGVAQRCVVNEWNMDPTKDLGLRNVWLISLCLGILRKTYIHPSCRKWTKKCSALISMRRGTTSHHRWKFENVICK